MTGRSVSRLADSEPILLLPAAQAETSQPRAHSQYDITVARKCVVSRENDSNFNGIPCKRRLIMYLCRATEFSNYLLYTYCAIRWERPMTSRHVNVNSFNYYYLNFIFHLKGLLFFNFVVLVQ